MLQYMAFLTFDLPCNSLPVHLFLKGNFISKTIFFPTNDGKFLVLNVPRNPCFLLVAGQNTILTSFTLTNNV